MEEYRLLFDERIATLEKDNRWETIINIVWSQWEADPNNLNCLLCAGTQLWYTLLMMDYIRDDPSPMSNVELVPDKILQRQLMSVTRYGFNHFANNPIFNAYYGYMIFLMPYFFLDYNGDYSGWQEKGLNMICHAYSLEPNNPFVKAIYFEHEGFGKDTPFFGACKEIWSAFTLDQWGYSEVQQYFYRILCGDLFHKN